MCCLCKECERSPTPEEFSLWSSEQLRSDGFVDSASAPACAAVSSRCRVDVSSSSRTVVSLAGALADAPCASALGPSAGVECCVTDVAEQSDEYEVAATHISRALPPMLPEGALDSACNRSLGSLRWFRAYCALLGPFGLLEWVVEASPRTPETFKFGNGGRLSTVMRCRVPVACY